MPRLARWDECLERVVLAGPAPHGCGDELRPVIGPKHLGRTMSQDSQVKHFDHIDGSHAPLNAESQVLARELINDVTDLKDTPSLTHRPTTDSPSPKSRATDAIEDPVSNTRHATSRRYSGVKRRRVPIPRTSLSAGTHTRLTKCQRHQPKPINLFTSDEHIALEVT